MKDRRPVRPGESRSRLFDVKVAPPHRRKDPLLSTPALHPGDSLTVGGHALPVWPKGQRVETWRNTRSVLVTRFTDHELYAPSLRRMALERSTDPRLAHQFKQGAGVGSAKVYDIDKWPNTGASLVNARALAFFRLATGSESAVVDLSWASVYHDGDYCLPHSHPRTLISVIYVLDVGDTTPTGGVNGTFMFADPRLAACCCDEEGYLSTPGAPVFEPGMMMLFPGKVVHCVSPYHGDRPRITMSWDLNKAAREGDPLPNWVQRPG
ncbi:MAG: putative 2OG-Fe(II) oxygenase [Paracoccaceae bacterium]